MTAAPRAPPTEVPTGTRSPMMPGREPSPSHPLEHACEMGTSGHRTEPGIKLAAGAADHGPKREPGDDHNKVSRHATAKAPEPT